MWKKESHHVYKGRQLTQAWIHTPSEINFILKRHSVGKTNVKPRLRMVTLYSVAQPLGHMVAGIRNKSEEIWVTSLNRETGPMTLIRGRILYLKPISSDSILIKIAKNI